MSLYIAFKTNHREVYLKNEKIGNNLIGNLA